MPCVHASYDVKMTISGVIIAMHQNQKTVLISERKLSDVTHTWEIKIISVNADSAFSITFHVIFGPTLLLKTEWCTIFKTAVS